MRLRRFSGSSVSAALADVKRTLGDEALILATRHREGGGVEITAATDVDRVVSSPPDGPPPRSGALAVPEERIATLEDLLQSFGTQLRRMDRRLGAAPAPGGVGVPDGLSAESCQLAGGLAEHGLPPSLSVRIAEAFERRRSAGASFDQAIADAIMERLPTVEGTPAANVRFLVGPTGSGKTTTIAKLAAEDLLAGRGKPVLLMGDTVRIGAADQLAAFARLLDVPMHAVQSDRELRARIAEADGQTPIYVDTAGLSSDGRIGRSIHALVDACERQASITAVVSATASGSSLQRAWAQLEGLQPESCVVTHVDESDEPGVACSWLEELGLPLRWLGTGQRISEDLADANGANLALWLVAA